MHSYSHMSIPTLSTGHTLPPYCLRCLLWFRIDECVVENGTFSPHQHPLSLYVSILLTTISINVSNAKLKSSQIQGYLKTLCWRQALKIKYANSVVASKRSQCLSSSKKSLYLFFWHQKPVSSTNHIHCWSKAILGHRLSGTRLASVLNLRVASTLKKLDTEFK